MNIASGITKFFPLAMIQQDGNPYVRDDTMFIKVVVDFGDKPKTLLPYVSGLNPGLPMHIQQLLIKQEAERTAQQQPQPQPTPINPPLASTETPLSQEPLETDIDEDNFNAEESSA
ncbi:unnamed protein product [Rotaria magnacalcarata]|uniref:MATH domain-containing protein n=1 Tax=Rotaria magnacalcarata TaxID=392030 RepID=A0A815WI53_9BILA|nr:unnamed protein product [Rotaria magnacalcarata]CAF5208800.1 unnamed protein product [Rotaria magnacalcarata]